MNRRHAIAALMALPEVTRISKAAVKPNDVIVIETDTLLSDSTMARIHASLQQVWPGQKIVVLCDGMRLKVVDG